MTRQRRFPLSLWWFVPALLCWAGYLMGGMNYAIGFMFGYFFFTPVYALTVNLGFLSLAGEVWFGRIARWWLAAPVVWVGFLLGLAWMSNAEIAQYREELRAANAGVKVPFDPARQDLLGYDDFDPSRLLQLYDLPVVYSQRANLNPQPNRLAYRIGGAGICQQIKSDPELNKLLYGTRQIIARSQGRPAWPIKYEKDLCLYQLEEKPSKPVVTISFASKDVSTNWAIRRESEITITDASGTKHVLRYGSVGGLKDRMEWMLVPLPPAMFFRLFDWSNEVSFPHNRELSLGAPEGATTARTAYDTPLVLIAGALGLKPSPVASRREAINAASAGQLEQQLEPQIDAALTLLDAVLEEPAKAIPSADAAQIKQAIAAPDELMKRAPKIGDALVAGFADPEAALAPKLSADAALALQRIVSGLSAQAFAAEGPRLMQALAANYQTYAGPLFADFVRRFGDLGPAASPLLELIAFAPRPDRKFQNDLRGAALEGLCRTGHASPDGLLKLQVELNDGYPMIGFVSLLRMGHPDLIQLRRSRWDSQYMKPSADLYREIVSPKSGPEVCDPNYWSEVRRKRSGLF